MQERAQANRASGPIPDNAIAAVERVAVDYYPGDLGGSHRLHVRDKALAGLAAGMMLSFPEDLPRGGIPCDMRKSFISLFAIAEETPEKNPRRGDCSGRGCSR